jgi:hypothetical protein
MVKHGAHYTPRTLWFWDGTRNIIFAFCFQPNLIMIRTHPQKDGPGPGLVLPVHRQDTCHLSLRIIVATSNMGPCPMELSRNKGVLQYRFAIDYVS